MKLYDVMLDGEFFGAILARSKDEARFRVAAIVDTALRVAYRTLTIRLTAQRLSVTIDQ